MSSTRQFAEPDDLSELHVDQQLCLALQTSSSLITRLYRKLLAPLGLTHPQYLVLIALWELDGPTTMGDLGDRISLETGSLTPLIKRMENAELVTRKRDDRDKRRVWVQATTRRGDFVRSYSRYDAKSSGNFQSDQTRSQPSHGCCKT